MEKKVLLFIVSLLVLSGFLFAAGTTEGQDEEPAEELADVDPWAPIDGKEYLISLVSYQVKPIAEDAIMLNYWNEKYGVEFEVRNVDRNNHFEVLDLMFAAGDVPDQIFCKWQPAYRQYVAQGVLAEVPENVIKKYAPDAYRLIMEMEPNSFKYISVDGKTYGLPRHFNFNSVYRRALVWRGDWLSNVGIGKTPDTLEEYEDAFYKFTRNDPDGNGVDDTYGLSFSGLECVFGAFGYMNEKWQTRDGKLVYCSVQPEVKQALSLMHKWYEDGVLDPNFAEGENTTSEAWYISDSFFNGRIGFTGKGSYNHWYAGGAFDGDQPGPTITALSQANPDALESLEFSLPPMGTEGKRGMYLGTLFTGHVTGYGVQNEQEKDKIGKMLWLANEMSAKSYESYLSTNYGIQGEHWNFDDNGNVVFVGDWAKGAYRSEQGGHTVLQTIKIIDYDKRSKKALTDWADKMKMNVGGLKNELLTALPSDIDYKDDLLEMERQVFIEIISGVKPVDYFDEFVASWRKGGGDILEREANEWYKSLGF